MAVNENSILTQNIYRKDKTFSTLKEETKVDFGYEYEKIIDQALRTLKRIDYYLDSESQMKLATISLQQDIMSRQKAIPEAIQYFFDRYTYRILCSEVAYMNLVDAIISDYTFNCPNYDFHLWCLKAVAIRFSHLTEPHLIANLHAINVTVHIPLAMLSDNLTLRGIRMNFDHVSPNAKSFFQKVTIPSDNINAGIQDLPESLLNEWLMQIQIQTKVSNSLRQQHEEYEDKLRQIDEALAARKAHEKNKGGDGDKKKKPPVIPKAPKEPQVLPPDMYPEVYDEFLVEEQKQYENFINVVFHPDSLKLTPGEINLKKYIILGGVYQLYTVEKPRHVDFRDFNMTWHKDDGLLRINTSWMVERLEEPPRVSTISRKLKDETHPHDGEAAIEEDKDLLPEDLLPQCPWFVVTFILPEYLCYWGEPMACHYEMVQELVPLEDIQVEEEVVVPPTRKRTEFDESIVRPSHDGGESLLSTQSRLSVAAFNIKDVMPFTESILKMHKKNRYRSRSNFFTPSTTHLAISSMMSYSPINMYDGNAFVRDFRFKIPLTLPQIRYMERTCVPRLLSSYKFPKEVHDEQNIIMQSRSKGKGGTIIRKQTDTEEVTDDSNRMFTFDTDQNNPERLFVVFPKEDPAHIADRIKPFGGELPTEPETFFQLMHVVNLIKRNFQFSLRHLLHLPNFRSPTDFYVHRRKIKDRAVKPKQEIKEIEIIEEFKRGSDTKRLSKRGSKLLSKSYMSLRSFVKVAAQESQMVVPEAIEEPEEPIQPPIDEKDLKLVEYTHWTTNHVKRYQFDRETRKFTIVTDRLGNLGFAFKRYEHFPFKSWELVPSEEDPENEVIFTLETQYVKIVLRITGAGIRGFVTEPTKRFVRNPKMYLVIEEPLRDYTEFKKRFKEKHLNIFADHDARFYIENGYFSEKHLATELHTYNCMASHCNHMNFTSSQWNRLASRRDIVMHFLDTADTEDNRVLVRITPDESSFVEITELCSDSEDIINLQFTPTWRNVTSYCDLHYLICSMYLGAMEQRCKSPKLMCCLKSLLSEIRPLSFS